MVDLDHIGLSSVDKLDMTEPCVGAFSYWEGQGQQETAGTYPQGEGVDEIVRKWITSNGRSRGKRNMVTMSE